MESKDLHAHLSTRGGSPEELPPPSKCPKTTACFDSAECDGGLTCQSRLATAATTQGDPRAGKVSYLHHAVFPLIKS